MKNIKILDMPISELRENIKLLYKKKSKENLTDIDKKSKDIIKNIVSDRYIKEMFKNLQDIDYVSNLSYENLAKIEEASRTLSKHILKIKSEVELNNFLKHGYNLDIASLKKLFRRNKIKKRYPNLNIETIRKLYVYPPKAVKTIYNPLKLIEIDAFVFRKYIISIIQMIFNRMDIVICNIGDEGAGKSCKSSQDMYILWWIMKTIGLIDYEFIIKEIMANTLSKFSDLEDKYYGNPFRILCLDEGNELNRQDWKEDPVKLFWQRLRRERHEQRIKIINIPVLGELILNIVLSRINFIFDMKNANQVKTGTLHKGDYNFYIIPRGSEIYSPDLNKNITKSDIKNILYNNLKDKQYLKGLPKDIRIKKCHCNGVWAFPESEYIKEMKETNKSYTVTKGIKFGPTELYSFFKSNPTIKKLGVPRDALTYPSLRKMIWKIKNYWLNDPLLLQKYDNIFKEKKKIRDNSNDIFPK